jgi:subtilisin family serine protease
MNRRAMALAAILMIAILTVQVSAAAPLLTPDAGLHNAASADTSVRPGPASIGGTGTGAPKSALGPEYYIVQLVDEPLAAYDGSIPGRPPTSPSVTGAAKLDASAPASVSYLNYLTVKQDSFVRTAARTVGHPVKVLHHYQYALNGVAVWLSPQEAARLATLPGVVHIERNSYESLDTDVGPHWIGAGGIWDGSSTGGLPGTKGEGVIVGMVDTGINSDHPSFASVGADGYQHTNPLGKGKYLGFCDPANPKYDPKLTCTDKLIGIWSWDDSLNDPEDRDGHGSHTSSTVAGNVVQAHLDVPTGSIPRMISGVAPHANIIAYDACIPGSPIGVCPGTATVEGIDQAVADGVDVINFSIGVGNDSPWDNARATAFLNARKANVIVVTAAGNDGPTDATVHSTAPWLLTVAAATHSRAGFNILGSMTGGKGQVPADITGTSYTRAFGPAKIVYAKTVANITGQLDNGQCDVRFDAGALTGAIVVCDVGGKAADEKIRNVVAGGAGGFVLANDQAHGNVTGAGEYSLPGVNISYTDGQTLKTWLGKGTGHQATIRGATVGELPRVADILASFSSRGPAQTQDCCYRPDSPLSLPALADLVKPDVTAPGVSILAAVNTDRSFPSPNPEFARFDGTSMASPHVAGAAALMRAVHPNWTPAQVQSALMSTTSQTVRMEDGVNPASPFDGGSGRVDVSRAARAGLLLDIPYDDFVAANPAVGGDPKTLNLPSLANSRCAVNCDWTRTVSSALSTSQTWTASATSDSGLMLTVEPGQFTLAPGQTQSLHIVANDSGVSPDSWAFGNIRLAPADTSIPETHFPVAVRSVTAYLPRMIVIDAKTPSGRQVIPGVQTQTAPNLTLGTYGLTKATNTSMALTEDTTPDDPYDKIGGTLPAPGTLDGTAVLTVDVPSGTQRLVAEMTISDAPDVDLYVGYDSNRDGRPQKGEQLCMSAGPTWSEYCNVDNPRTGKWWILVESYQGSKHQPDPMVLASAVVPNVAAANVRYDAPTSVQGGVPFDLGLNWDLGDLEKGDRWFGQLLMGSGPGSPSNLAVVPIDLLGPTLATPTPTPTATPFVWPTDAPTPTPTPTSEVVRSHHVYLPHVVWDAPATPTPPDTATPEVTVTETTTPQAEGTGTPEPPPSATP